MSVNCHEAFGVRVGKLRSSVASDRHACELIIKGLSVTAVGLELLGGHECVYTKLVLGMAAASASDV